MTASRLFRPETRSKKPRPLRRRTGCGVRRQNGPGGGAANEGPPPRAGRRPLSALAQHHPPPQRSQPGLGSRRVGRCDCTPGIFIHHTLSLQGPRSARPPPLQHAARRYGVGRWVLRVLNYRCRSFSRLLFTSSPPPPPELSTPTARASHALDFSFLFTYRFTLSAGIRYFLGDGTGSTQQQASSRLCIFCTCNLF